MPAENILFFDRFRVDLLARKVVREEHTVVLGPRAFDVLAVLAQRPGHVVSKEELLAHAWPGRVVEENNIAAQVVALRKALGADLIVTVPGRGYKMTALPKRVDEAKAASAPAPVANRRSPRVVRELFGRSADLERLQPMLRSPGCLTLVGPGGVGKTALARALAAPFGEGCHWIDLADLEKGASITPAICRAFSPPLQPDDKPALALALRSVCLLVLDNAEHLVDGVARLVLDLLSTASQLRVLVTSRLPLGLVDEQVERIEPLAMPDEKLAVEEALSSGAVGLLTRRIAEADSRFRLQTDSIPLLKELCVELDCLPLMLEMAAARVPLLGLQGVVGTLGRRLTLLRKSERDAPDRHRTAQATLDWSYELLDEPSRCGLRALSVFAGGFTPTLAVRVAWPDEDPIDAYDRFAALVDASLVATDHAEPPRCRLLETTRDYAMARLRDAGEEKEARGRHAAEIDRYFAGLGDAPSVVAVDAQRWAAQAEMANAEEALGWAMVHDSSMALRLSSNAMTVAFRGVWRFDASNWLENCRPLAEAETAVPAWRALWWRTYCSHLLLAHRQETLEVVRHAIGVCRGAASEWNLAHALLNLVYAPYSGNEELLSALAEARFLVEQHPEWSPSLRARLAGTQGYVHEMTPDFEAALAAYGEVMLLARKFDLPEMARYAAVNSVNMLRKLGRGREALAVLRSELDLEAADNYHSVFGRVQELRILIDEGDLSLAIERLLPTLSAARRIGLVTALEAGTLVLAKANRPRAAALMFGHTEQAFSDRGAMILMEPNHEMPTALALIESQLDARTFAVLRDQGRRLDAAAIDGMLLSEGQDANDRDARRA